MPDHTVHPLDPTTEAQLRAAELTYDEVGATRGPLPPGYHHQRRETVVGTGARRFGVCAEAVLTWQVQLRAGIEVHAAPLRVVPDGVVRIGLGVGPLRLHAPARVVYVVEEPRRVGFAYGTLAGHPESGEELFVVEHRDDDSVVFGVAAFSRPGSLITRLAGPLGTVAQRIAARRYLRGVATLPD